MVVDQCLLHHLRGLCGKTCPGRDIPPAGVKTGWEWFPPCSRGPHLTTDTRLDLNLNVAGSNEGQVRWCSTCGSALLEQRTLVGRGQCVVVVVDYACPRARLSLLLIDHWVNRAGWVHGCLYAAFPGVGLVIGHSDGVTEDVAVLWVGPVAIEK